MGALKIYQSTGGHVELRWYLTVVALSIIIALFQYGFEQYRKLETSISVLECVQYAYPGNGAQCYGFRIPVLAKGASETIRNVNARLIDIQPKWQGYTWGSSAPLHWKDDNREPHSRTRDVQAGTSEEIDLAYAGAGDQHISIFHIAEGVDRRIPNSRKGYRLKVEVKGDNVNPCIATYRLWMDDQGILRCVPL